MTREEKEAALHCLKAMIDEEVCEECPLYGTTGTDHCEADCVRVAIKALEQEPKAGHWVDITNKNGTVIAVRCSCCKESPKHAIKSDFCPNCGAKMVEMLESEGQT